MNIGLYEDITSKLELLSDEEKKPENIRTLMGQWSNRGNYTDMTSVLCAFYNFMEGKQEYSFVHSVLDWENFFREGFSSHFTIDTIKTDFDNIIHNDKIVDIILNFTSEEVQKEFYMYAVEINTLGKENGINVYEGALNKLEDKLVAKGLIIKPVEIEPINMSEDKGQNFLGDALSSAGIDIEDIGNSHVGLDNIVTDSIESQQIAGTTIDAVVQQTQRPKVTTNVVEQFIPKPEITAVQGEPIVSVEPINVSPKVAESVTNRSIPKPAIKVSEPNITLNSKPSSLKNSQPKTAAEIASELRKAQELQEKYRNDVFATPSKELGINSKDLINKVGDELSFDIDKIIVDEKLKEKIASKEAKIASLPDNVFKKMATKVNKRKNLKRMNIEVINDNNYTTVKIAKKDTVFDKIATTSNKVLNAIKTGAKYARYFTIGVVELGALTYEKMVEAMDKNDDYMIMNANNMKQNNVNMNDKIVQILGGTHVGNMSLGEKNPAMIK